MHQQVLLALRAATGGGSPPNTYGNLTFWYDADNSPIYVSGSTTSGTPGDGDPAGRVDSNNSIARTFFGSATKRNGYFSAGNAIDVTIGSQSLYTRPTGTADPTTTQNMSSLVSTTNKTLIWAGRVNSASGNSGNPYTNPPILGEGGGYFGLHCYQSGSDIVFQAYNYDNTNGERVVTATEAASTPVIISLRHSSNVLRIRKNGVEIATISALTTTTLANNAFTGSSFALFTNQLITYNAARTDAEMLEVEKWCSAKLGITI
jgi:hypothetical protein